MRVLVAPCSFKESLTASAAAEVLARAAAGRGHVVDSAPVADGGEGTLDALRDALRLELRSSVIRGMLGADVRARWGVDRAAGRAIVEAAEVVGLGRVPFAARDPLAASTAGIGALVLEAAREPDVHEVLLALGGTGTVDGGAGMLRVLEEARARGERLVPVHALVDVDVPLAGARLFMRQKLGARDVVTEARAAEVIEALAARLAALYPDEAIAGAPGAGAAGGLGAAVLALGGRLLPGAAFVMDAVGLEERVPRADVVWTGEGRIDEQTVHGKAVASLARTCAALHKPLVAFCGTARGDLAALRAIGVTEVVPIAEGVPLAEALARAPSLLAAAADRLLDRTR